MERTSPRDNFLSGKSIPSSLTSDLIRKGRHCCKINERIGGQQQNLHSLPSSQKTTLVIRRNCNNDLMTDNPTFPFPTLFSKVTILRKYQLVMMIRKGAFKLPLAPFLVSVFYLERKRGAIIFNFSESLER